MTAAELTISQIARAAGVNVETVRYYQRRGLVGLPPKRARGFRYYAPQIASRKSPTLTWPELLFSRPSTYGLPMRAYRWIRGAGSALARS
jgi:MerR family regulatory protein